MKQSSSTIASAPIAEVLLPPDDAAPAKGISNSHFPSLNDNENASIDSKSSSSLSDDISISSNSSGSNNNSNSSSSYSDSSCMSEECDEESTKSYHSSRQEDELFNCANKENYADDKDEKVIVAGVPKIVLNTYRTPLHSPSDEGKVTVEEGTRSRFFADKQSTNMITKAADPIPEEFQRKRQHIRNPNCVRSVKATGIDSKQTIPVPQKGNMPFNSSSNTRPQLNPKSQPPKNTFISTTKNTSHPNLENPPTNTKDTTNCKLLSRTITIKKNPYCTGKESSTTKRCKTDLNHTSEQGLFVGKMHIQSKEGIHQKPKRTHKPIVFDITEDEDTQRTIAEPIVQYFNERTECNQCIRVKDVFGPRLSTFFRFEHLNIVQSQVFQDVSRTNQNVVVAAPTGAGKTCIFEMAIIKLLSQNMERNKISKQNKVVYIAPNKALCDERMHDWSSRFSALGLGIKVGLVTGDVWDTNEAFNNVAQSHIILTTPEKWDSVTRRWTDHLHIIRCVKLLLIDEVHLLGDSTRGPCLETVICRMKTVRKASNSTTTSNAGAFTRTSQELRMVAVSATLPNIVDIAIFLEASASFSFNGSYRPVPLSTHVLGFGWIGKNQYLFDRGLNKHVLEVVSSNSNNKPTIIFCHTKKETEDLASSLANSNFVLGNRQSLAQATAKVSIRQLKNCISKGTAYHHAGMEASDRQVVEQAFATGAIRCLCATSTLAMGVNLPAHLVIVKGTSAWRGAGTGHAEIDRGTLLQMMGRAGRPGFDTAGVAVIMTDNASTKKYQTITDGMEVVESNLMGRMIETINTEVSQKVISNVNQAIAWIKGTYFFVRVRKNPAFYGMQEKTEHQMNAYLKEKCMESLTELSQADIISVLHNGVDIAPLPASHIMSRNLVPFIDMKRFMNLPYECGTREILFALSECEGLHRPVRRSEKRLLNEVYKQVKYKFDGPQSKVKIQKSNQKAFVLLQAAIGQLYLEDFTLRQEMTFTVDYANRILKAAEDYSVEGSKHGGVALDCLLLRRSLSSSLWGSEDGILNQLQGVGAKTTEKLKASNIKSFEDVVKHSTFTLENVTSRRSPFGQELRDAVNTILQNSLSVTATIEDNGETGQKMIVCRLEKCNAVPVHGFKTMSRNNSGNIVSYTLTVHHNRPSGLLMFRKFLKTESIHKVPCPCKFGKISVRLVANLVGIDCECFIHGDSPVKKEVSLTPKGKLSSTTPRTVRKSKHNSQKQDNKMSKEREPIIIDDRRGATKYKGGVRKNTPLSSEPKTFTESSSVTPSPRTLLPVEQMLPVRNSAKRSTLHSMSGQTNNSFTETSSNIKGFAKAFTSINTETNQVVHRRTDPPKSFATPSSSLRFKTSWQQQKKTSKSLQQNAYSSPKSNPFASFKFDPNAAESQLDMLAQQSTIALQESEMNARGTGSIIPTGNDFGSTYFSQNKLQHSRTFGGNLRTPARHGVANSIRKRKRDIFVSNQDLLRLKANEQSNYTRRVVPQNLQYAQQSNQLGIQNHERAFQQSSYSNFDPDQEYPASSMAYRSSDLSPLHHQHAQLPTSFNHQHHNFNNTAAKQLIMHQDVSNLHEQPSIFPRHFIDRHNERQHAIPTSNNFNMDAYESGQYLEESFIPQPHAEPTGNQLYLNNDFDVQFQQPLSNIAQHIPIQTVVDDKSIHMPNIPNTNQPGLLDPYEDNKKFEDAFF